MGEEPGTVGAEVDAVHEYAVQEERDPERIREEIEATRRELGDTVEALVAKTDVKARAHEKVASVRESVTPKALGVGGGGRCRRLPRLAPGRALARRQIGVPQSGNHRSSSGSTGSSLPICALATSSRSLSRCSERPAAGANG